MFGKKKEIEDHMACPFMGGEPCMKHKCALYVEMSGKDKNDGEEFVRKGACAMAWQPTLQLEGNQMLRELGAATESLRNKTDESIQVNTKTQTFICRLLAILGIKVGETQEKIQEKDK